MTTQQAGELVALVRAGFPRERVEPETYKLYARFLADLDYPPAREAVTRLLCRSRFFPSIAELRAEYAELALGLPGELEAFALAEAFAAWRPQDGPCTADGCTDGFVDVEREHACGVCHGTGLAVVNRLAPLPGPVADAYRYVGGRHGFLNGEPGITRAHFRDAYRQARAQALERVSTQVGGPKVGLLEAGAA